MRDFWAIVPFLISIYNYVNFYGGTRNPRILQIEQVVVYSSKMPFSNQGLFLNG